MMRKSGLIFLTISLFAGFWAYGDVSVPEMELKVKKESLSEREARLRKLNITTKDQKKSFLLLESPIIKKDEDIYGPSRFMHKQHARSVGSCAKCHHLSPDREGAEEVVACSRCHQESFDQRVPERVGLKAAYHLQCTGCHREMNKGPIDCAGCHSKRHSDHSTLIKPKKKYANAREVIQGCLKCHGRRAEKYPHWTLQNHIPELLKNPKLAVKEGDKICYSNTLQEVFCLEDLSGLKGAFGDGILMDCLLCHDTTGQYNLSPSKKAYHEVANKVGMPQRKNCGNCHFLGVPGSPAVPSALSASFVNPKEDFDIHMGRKDFVCQDCHKHTDSTNALNKLTACEECHTEKPHGSGPLDHHLNRHTEHTTCITCHAPLYGKTDPALLEFDPKGKPGHDVRTQIDKATSPAIRPDWGSWVWQHNGKPFYMWDSGYEKNMKWNSKVSADASLVVRTPVGRRKDRHSRISPFRPLKMKHGISKDGTLQRPAMQEGFEGPWQTGKWEGASWKTSKAFIGLEHGVLPKNMALSCVQCHSSLEQGCVGCHSNFSKRRTCNRCHRESKKFSFKSLATKGMDFSKLYHEGRCTAKFSHSSNYIDFERLGYKGDPIVTGGRFKTLPLGYKK